MNTLLYKKRFFPLILRVFVLAFFVFLLLGAWGITTADKGFAKILRNTNLSNLLVWSYWWPMVIVTAVLVGRHWCTICPVELLTSCASMAGMRKKPGRILKSGWMITLFYGITLIVGIHTLSIHRIPHRMAIYMSLLLGFSVLVGLIWEKRTFCNHICPVGHLLGLYSLMSMTQWRVKDQKTCSECKSKECIDNDRVYNLTARSCTSNLYPAKIKDNRKCILCSQCLTSCPHDNPGLRLRKPMSDLLSELKLSGAEVLFVIMVSGFIVYEILSEGNSTKGLLLAVPNAIFSILPVGPGLYGTVKSLVLFICFPALFFAIFSALRTFVTKESFRNSLSSVAIAILPVMASMHLLKAALKMSSRIPYWSYALHDYRGVDTAKAIASGSLHLHSSLLTTIHPALIAFSVIAPAAGFALSAWAVTRREKIFAGKSIAILAAFCYAALFGIGIASWYF